MAFLRVLLVCILIFFAVVAIRKMPKNPPASSAAAPAPTQTQPIAEPQKTTSTPRPVSKKQVATEPQVEPTTPEPAPTTEERPALRLTPTKPSSGLPDTLTFTVQQCRRVGEYIECYGLAKTSAEIPQHIELKDSRASDDQGRSFVVYLQDGFSFDTGWNEKLVPGTPLRFGLRVHDPYPSSKTLNLRLTIYYFGEQFHVYSDVHELIYKDIPIQ